MDTGFLITIFDEQRPDHATAQAMYHFFIDHQFLLYLSSVVVSEFCVRGDIKQLPLGNFLPLSFDLYDGVLAGKLNFTNFLNPDDQRSSVKDDVKLLAQMQKNNIAYFATQDGHFARKIAAKFPGITPIIAADEVTRHFSVHRGAAGTVVARAVEVGQTSLF